MDSDGPGSEGWVALPPARLWPLLPLYLLSPPHGPCSLDAALSFMPLFAQVGTTSRNVLCHFCLTRTLGKSLLNPICCPPSPSGKCSPIAARAPFHTKLSLSPPPPLAACLLLHPHTWHSAWQGGEQVPRPRAPSVSSQSGAQRPPPSRSPALAARGPHLASCIQVSAPGEEPAGAGLGLVGSF